MANKYDRILKENLKPIIPFLLKHIPGLELVQLEEMKDKIQTTLEREANFVQKIVAQDPKDDEILHCEVQINPELDMDKRMLLYYAMYYSTYKLPVRQFVIYIGDKEFPNFNTKIAHKNLQFEYKVINLRDFDVELFLTSDKPEEIILAILANFGTNQPEEVVRRILGKIPNIVGSGLKMEKYSRQLQVLSVLRNLQPITDKILTDMAFTFDIRNDTVYQRGVSDATQAYTLKTELAIRNMLTQTDLTIEQIANIQSVEVEVVVKIQRALVKEKKK